MKVLKLAFPAIKKYILHLFNYSLIKATFPEQWKISHILPIVKTPHPKAPSDYRPVSLLDMLSKIFEKCVSYQVMNHLISNNIIDPLQSGFRPGYSPETCLLRLTEDIKQNKAKKLITALILFDFTKAFDRVNYNILFNKLKKYGFDDNAINWFRTYLVGRKQQVITSKHDRSEWGSAENGVPQGSVLGPLLFLIYINDIGTAFKTCRRLLYADDLQIYVSFPLEELQAHMDLIQADIERLADWCLVNSLTLNTKKTQAIFFGHKTYTDRVYSEYPILKTRAGEIQVVPQVSNLGILMDSALTWGPQIDSICNKVNSVLYRLKRMSAFTNKEIRCKLISTLIFPLFDYCAAVYGDLSGTLDSKIQVALNSCVRHVEGLGWRTHITPYRIELGWLSARNRRLYLSSRLVHKILLTSCPSYLSNLFKYTNPIYPSRREGPQIKVQFTTSQQLLDSFSTHIANFWNGLPPSLRMVESVEAHKKHLKKFLLQSEQSQLNLVHTP